MYPFGLVGNCQIAALVSAAGSIDWLCLPQPDHEPVFGRLLDPAGGHFSIEPPDTGTRLNATQRYLENTNVLITECEDSSGNRYRITDFCPRFGQFGRMYRPVALFRILEPLVGSPTVSVSCEPVTGWTKEKAGAVRGSSHLRYEIRGETLRLTTNMPLTYLSGPTPFALHGKIYFALTWGVGLEDNLIEVSERFLQETVRYWENWVKHCSIPSLYQRETIRSALALKLHCYEDTGAILASVTTSLAEESGGVRNWDYRYCWLRDAYFVLSAFHNLGHFEEMEEFLKFLLNIASQGGRNDETLRPVYTLTQKLPLPEVEQPKWQGFALSRPVRVGNQAAEHVQNDVYGEMILTLAPIFFDERFYSLRTKAHENLLSDLAELCAGCIGKPDAGLWEVRQNIQEHTFTNLLSWAGCERLARIRGLGFLKSLSIDPAAACGRAEQALKEAVRDGSLRNGPKDPSFDAALVQSAILRFPDRDICKETLAQVMSHLRFPAKGSDPGFFYRYLRPDDFGQPKSAFVACSFWIIQALAQLGSLDLAKQVMEQVLSAGNSLGLFSEHFDVENGTQKGNFPQTYSHVGLINAAFGISPAWREVL